jgi:mRNA interferase MazF
MNRGDVVIVEFPYVDGRRGKNRPALVVQNDRDNQRLANTIIAMITGNLRFTHLSTQLRIDVNTAEGKASGLVKSSAIKAGSLFTIQQRDILAVIGRLSDDSLRKFDQCLKAALELS